jgi:hypothetical protein
MRSRSKPCGGEKRKIFCAQRTIYKVPEVEKSMTERRPKRIEYKS